MSTTPYEPPRVAPSIVDAATTKISDPKEVLASPKDVHTCSEFTDAWRQFRAYATEHPLWLAAMSIFLFVWTGELFLVQEWTLIYPNDVGALFAFGAPKIRLLLDFLFLGAITMLLRRRWLVPVLIGSFFAYLGMLTYFQFFQSPISLLTIMNNWYEGSQLGSFAWDLFPAKGLIFLSTALAIKLVALAVAKGPGLPRAAARVLCVSLLAVYCSLYALTILKDPLSAIRTTRGVARLGAMRGYLGPWLAEWYYLADDQLLEQAVGRRANPYDRLTPIETDIPIRKHLVILQVESLDTNILNVWADGRPVTPYLNQLKEHSMYYRVRSFHKVGSADADFSTMMAVPGSEHMNTYKIIDYPYENTTPQLLAECGYDTYSFHGHSGSFYSRRQAFNKMGFRGIFFREELQRDFDLATDAFGIRDADVMSVSAQMLRTSKTPTCHVVITLTSHSPYTMLLPNERQIFPNPANRFENYANSIRYTDGCVRDYITSLGKGTTVLVYADHPTELETSQGDFVPDKVGGADYVPCFIYDSDEDLSLLQKTRDLPIATNGMLNMVDIINYLRGQIKRTCDQDPIESETETVIAPH